MNRLSSAIVGLTLLFCAAPLFGQALPRLAALYPAGATAGTTVEVAVQSGGLEEPRRVIVTGSGLTAELAGGGGAVDPEEQKLFEEKCAMCHDLRGPGTLSRTPEQWAATVDRMIRERSAPIERADRDRIVNYLEAAARASAGLTARITVAPDAAPGRREIRIVGANGTTTVYPFEVTARPELLEIEPNNSRAEAQPVELPVVINGRIEERDTDTFSFEAKQGERLVFNCSAYRLNPQSQAFFFPVLYLYDADGKELARNDGYFSLDPLIDWTAPADGRYFIAIRDMLYRGSPSSIYRLSIGSLPYDTYVYPAGGRRGMTLHTSIIGENLEYSVLPVTLPEDAPVGVQTIPTEYGEIPFAVGDYDEVFHDHEQEVQEISLPVSINGRMTQAGERHRYRFTVPEGALGPYTFELLSDQIGSPLVGRLRILNARNQQQANNTRGSGLRGARIDHTFGEPGDYFLEVLDVSGETGPRHIYRVSAGPARPDLQLTVTPDNPNLGPGSSIYLTVRVARRVGVAGAIQLSVPNLPEGVTASPAVIPAGENQGFLILTAARDAKPGEFAVTNVVARARARGETVLREVTPLEVYRIRNNNRFEARSNLVVTVGPESGWRVTIEPPEAPLVRGGQPLEVKLRLNRRGANGDISFALAGVPAGVNAPRNVMFRRGENEFTLTLRPTNGGVFAADNDSAPDHFLLALVNGSEGQGQMMSSAPVRIPLQRAGGG